MRCQLLMKLSKFCQFFKFTNHNLSLEILYDLIWYSCSAPPNLLYYLNRSFYISFKTYFDLVFIRSKNCANRFCIIHYRERFATMVVTMAEKTSIFCWLDIDAKVRTIPQSCLEWDSCFSRYVNRQESGSLGRTGWWRIDCTSCEFFIFTSGVLQ